MMATLSRAARGIILYILSPVLYGATSLTTALTIPWLLLSSVTSTILIGFLGAHTLQDPNLVIFQFVYWCISWAWLVWRISPSLPAFLANQMANSTFFTVLVFFLIILAVFFADALFFTIVSSTSGDLGRYGRAHANFWGSLLSVRDILVGILGSSQREVVVPEASTSPPPPYSHVFDLPSSLVKSSMGCMAETV